MHSQANLETARWPRDYFADESVRPRCGVKMRRRRLWRGGEAKGCEDRTSANSDAAAERCTTGSLWLAPGTLVINSGEMVRVSVHRTDTGFHLRAYRC